MNWWETEFLAVKDNKLWIAGQNAESLAGSTARPSTSMARSGSSRDTRASTISWPAMPRSPRTSVSP